ncbi:MAG: hypothetical protein HKM93_06575 [Desulfobacteraceae bacterium]|nr:hypothetical protein [Desulfobacteraceae bacterium]
MAIFKSKPAVMGQVIEISKHGLSFSFIDDGEIMNKPLGIDLLKADDYFYLAHIPFRTIAENKIDNESGITPIPMKRKGIQFVDLTDAQRKKLIFFLTNHTNGEVCDQA